MGKQTRTPSLRHPATLLSRIKESDKFFFIKAKKTNSIQNTTRISFKDLLLCLIVLLRVGLRMHVQCQWRPEEGVRFPEAGVTGRWELPNAGTENQTQGLWKKSKFLNY